MTSNSGEIWTIVLAPFFGLPIPLLPIHILWINLVTDGLPGTRACRRACRKEYYADPPRHPQENILHRACGSRLSGSAFSMGGVSIFTQTWGAQNRLRPLADDGVYGAVPGPDGTRPRAPVRKRISVFTARACVSNRPLLGAVAPDDSALQLATIYVPFLNRYSKHSLSVCINY